MKKACCTLLCAASLAASSISAKAADITVDSSTLLGIAKRDITNASNETLLPATQFLGINADKLGDGNLSAHLYGWGRFDFADKSYNNDKTDGSITYGYLQYRFDTGNANVRAGRLFVREGIVNEQIDGISGRTDLPMGFGVSVFGGATVPTAHISGENSDGKGDTLYGGRATYRYKGLLELGVSGVFESDAPTLVAHPTGNYRRIGGDIWLSPVNTVDIIGHSSYNTETDTFAEHSYLLNFKPTRQLVLTGEFNLQRDQSYLYSWSTFSGAALNPNDSSSSVGVRASYEVSKNVTLATDYKHYTRESGSADRFGGDIKVNYQDNSIRGGLGYHYLDAGQEFAIGTNPSASYHELRCYAMHDTKSYFAAVDILGDFFVDKIYNESSAWEATTSLGYHVTPALALSGDVSYGRNPQFTQEVKGLLRLTYNYSGVGGKK